MDNKFYKECIEKLREISNEHPQYTFRWLRGDNKYLLDFIEEHVSEEIRNCQNATILTKLYWLLNGITKFPTCGTCGKKLVDFPVKDIRVGYPHFCSFACEKKQDYMSFVTDSEHDYTDEDDARLFEEFKSLIESEREYKRKIVSPDGEFHHLLDYIVSKTRFMNGGYYEFKTRVYFLINGIRDFPRCANPKCNKLIDFKNMRSIYEPFPKYCCGSCAHCEDVLSKNYTALEKHYGIKGIKAPFQVPEIKNAIEQKMMARYGAPSLFKSEEYWDKTKKLFLERYGVEYPLQSKEILKQTKQTLFEHYGVSHPSHSEIILNKTKNTNLERYGVTCVLASPEIKKRVIQTNLRKYGVRAATQNRDIFLKCQRRWKYDGIPFSSSWELYYYIWLKDNNIEFEYQPDVKISYTVGEDIFYYIPDFLVNGELVEIKGNHFFDKKTGKLINPYQREDDAKESAKYEAMIKNGVKILMEKDIKPFKTYVVNKYGKDFINQFRRNSK